MSVDQIILISVWVITILGLVCFVPRNKLREAQIVFLFKQLLTWLFGLLVVEFHLIEYPVRIFKLATHSSFSFEYFIYPAVGVVFVLRFPEHKSNLIKIGWYVLFPTWMTILEVLLERYTHLIHYIHWSWYWTWMTLLITFFLSRNYYLWFFKKSSDR
jgi:hypothetical protein